MYKQQEELEKMILKVDFNKEKGEILALNGSNLGPRISVQKVQDFNKSFRALKIPLVRLHDVPLENHGMRLVDIQHIFGNWDVDENDSRNYYFKQTDDYIRNCLAQGSQIVYRLGTSIEHTVNNYYAFPPQDFEKWTTICINIIRHYNEGWADGFGWNIQYWEIWNEPNAKPQMWSGDDTVYYRLYATAAKRIKERFPNVKVGGPALSCPVQYAAPLKYTDCFLEFCKKENAPLDFYSWHCYPTCLEEIVDEPARVRKVLDRFGFTETELHLNEWHYTPTWAETWEAKEGLDGINGIDSACFIANVLTVWQDTPLTMGCYYTASVLWGLYNAYEEKFKTYYGLLAFAEMLNYKMRVQVSSPDKKVAVLAGKNAEGRGAILVSAYQSPESTLYLKLRNVKWNDLPEALCLDRELNLQPVPVRIEDGTIVLEKRFDSALFLIQGLVCGEI